MPRPRRWCRGVRHSAASERQLALRREAIGSSCQPREACGRRTGRTLAASGDSPRQDALGGISSGHPRDHMRRKHG
jgi:hypothetical protein